MSIWLFTSRFLHCTVIIYCSWDQLFIWLWSYTGCWGYIFLDIFNAFDEVWHEGLLSKLITYGLKGEILNLLRNYLHERNQRVVLNGQISSWDLIRSEVPQVLVLGPLLLLIYINDLPHNILSTCKIFADNTSLFSHVSNKCKSQSEMNNDLQVISNWAIQWKIHFNPDPKKQAQEVYFSKKSNNENSLPVTLNNSKVLTCFINKHLRLLLDKRLSLQWTCSK